MNGTISKKDISHAVFCNNLDWEEDVGPFMCIICSVINKPDSKNSNHKIIP